MFQFWRFAWLKETHRFYGAESFWLDDYTDTAFFKICGRLYWRIEYCFD